MTFDNDSGRTHFPDCWRDPEHHACAVAMVERLLAGNDALTTEKNEERAAAVEFRDERDAHIATLRRIASCAHTIPHSDCAPCIAKKALRTKPDTVPAVPEPS